MPDFKNERVQLEAIQKFFQQKDFSEALKQAEKLLQEFPLSFQGKLFYAKILRALGRLVEAKGLLEDLDKQYPYNISVLSELAGILYSQKDNQESLILYNRILFLDSFNSEAKQKVEEIQQLLDRHLEEELDETRIDKEQKEEAAAKEEAPSPAPEMPLSILKKIGVEPVTLHLGDTGDFIPVKPGPLPYPKVEMAPRSMEGEPVDLHLGDTGDFQPIEPQPKGPADTNIRKDEAAKGIVVIEPGPSEPETAEEAKEATVPPPGPGTRATAEEREIVYVEPEGEPEAPAAAGAEVEIHFATESAAALYERQGLYREAAAVYKKLYEQTGDEKYQLKLVALEYGSRIGPVQQKMISALEKLLARILSLEMDHVQ